MVKFKGRKTIGYLPDINEKKIQVAWQLNFSIVMIVILSITVVGFISFRMISQSILNNTKQSAIQLVKQTSKNVETILGNLDDLALTISRDNDLSELVAQLNSTKDEHEKADCIRKIENILNNYAVNRSDIADIVVVTNSMEYITSGQQRPNILKDVSTYHVVQLAKNSGKKSAWIGTYTSDSDTTFASAGAYGQVVSLVKGIYTPTSLSSHGMLIINYKESCLFDLISSIKVGNGGKIYMVNSSGNFIMNQYNRALNEDFSQTDFANFINDAIIQENGSIMKKIEGKEHLVTFCNIKEVKGTVLGWRIILLKPVASITSAITNVGTKIFYLGLIGVTFGFIFSILLVRRYSFSVDKEYSEKHSIMMEQERLASLGQLIGGIAHNFKTPIMSISGGLEALKDLASEYDSSIDDASVTDKDHHEIAEEMREWVKKIRPYCSYMSDIISAVKGQAVNCNESSVESFTVSDLAKRVQILMNHELKKYQCHLETDMRTSELTEIKGEINNLVQVLNNLVSNSIEAYNGVPGKIDLVFDKKMSNLEITVRDFGSGIPEKVKNKLLKEMITTKGEKGTGIGLYMSYSTIKGKFAGTMSVESEEGKGTSIIITIPLKKK